MKFIKLTLIILLFCNGSIFAQSPEFPNAIGTRVLLMDYHQLAERTDLSFAYEVSYHRNLMKNVNLVIPARVGVINYPDLLKNGTYFSIDVLGQYAFNKVGKKLTPFIQAGIGPVVIFNDYGTDLSIPIGVGVEYQVSKRGSFNALAEYRISFPSGNNGIFLGIGAKYNVMKIVKDTIPTPKIVMDRDGDGIEDDVDLCPDVAGIVDFDGCPDTDGDGIKDSKDDCPEVAGVMAFNGCPDTDGDGISDNDDMCPNDKGTKENKGCPIMDTDGDGILDDVDKCPDMAGEAKYFGCPVVDSDNDGISDEKDLCPNSYGLAKFGGCPDQDNDGIGDYEDKCPTSYGPISNNGCPEITVEDRAVLDFALNNIQFNTSKASLKLSSYQILDQIVNIMNSYPDYHLKINGHTDNAGDEDENMDLSANRAKSCMVYLVERGVDPYRISYRGFGESQPIGDNNRTSGRAKNRRVEFDLYLN